MQLPKILTPLLAAAVLASTMPLPAQAQAGDDSVLTEMAQAYRKGDRKRLAMLLPQARGHLLEPWAAYWELKARLEDASAQEVDDFLLRYAGTYQEDRLRNDWLLLLGQRRDWEGFARHHPYYRMSDDKEVRCYALLVEQLKGSNTAPEALAEELKRNWYAQREADDGCASTADRMFAARRLNERDVWRKARLAIEANRLRPARTAVEIVAPEASAQVAELHANPARYLASKATAAGRTRQELVVLALLKIAGNDPDTAASLLESKWAVHLSQEERNWLWGAIGRQSALRLSTNAPGYFAQVSRDADLTDEMLAWKVRAMLRAGQWPAVRSAIAAMSPEAQRDSAWVYWKARALLAGRPSEAEREQAQQLYQSIAGVRGFYEQLAQEELGQRISVPERPQATTPEERQAAASNAGLSRALYAIKMGLRSEGTREWNYSTNLHQPGGMSDRELLAAAERACQQEVWDRCINTSERTKGFIDMEQRFPMPFRESVVRRAREINLDPAYVYGLIRQESRFIMDARSGVGASGLMQVMPATAKWTAKKIGMEGFTPGQINDRETNIAIGTAYLKLALDDFAGSMPLAAAAYNAGPGRPRSWRNGPLLDAAIWAENVPFTETRDYVKKVLSNTTNYAALLTGQPQSLKARLGTVGPRDAAAPEINKELP